MPSLATKRALRSIVACILCLQPMSARAQDCGFAFAFAQADEGGSRRVRVYEGLPSDGIGGRRPLAFVVPDLKVNTDGTRISYKADDPLGRAGAINDIRNAFRNPSRPVSDFTRLVSAGWLPRDRVFALLSPNIIERDARPGREGLPCIDGAGFLVSMTADTAIDGGFNRVGDCDQSKWIDALTIPSIVLPKGAAFVDRKAVKRSVAVVMTLDAPRRMTVGIVGDIGPATEIGEASVEMNRILNGLPPGAVPTGRQDAKRRFQAARSILLIFPGTENLVSRPITAERVQRFGMERFEAWGGEARMSRCLAEIPEAG